MAAIQLSSLLGGARDVAVVGNSVADSTWAFRLWDDDVRGARVVVRNNLFLAREGLPDAGFLRPSPADSNSGEPADGERLLERWTLGHNRRESRVREKGEGMTRALIPPAPEDRLEASIPLLSRDSTSSDYLRPAADSPLATAGAGGDLPAYVGAVAPPGAAAWAWERTWRWLTKEAR
jgi:hypothetical protein